MPLLQNTGRVVESSVSGTRNFNAASAFTAGSTAFLKIAHFDNGGATISSVTIGGTAAVQDVISSDGAGDNHFAIWRATNITGGTTAYSIVLSATAGQFHSHAVIEWSGVSNSSPLDASGTGNGTSTAPSATTSGSTTQVNVLLVGGFVDTAGTNWTSATPPSGWTESFEEPDGTTFEAGAAAYFEDGGATGTKTGTFGTGASMTWRAAIAAYKLTSTPPTITAQPVGNAAAVGATAQYSITETGATSYQWQVSANGGETWASVSGGSGGTTATYTTPTTVAGDNGKQYRCVATNSNGSTNSLGAWFHVSGIGLTYRGRGTSRERYSLHYTDVGAPHLPFDPRNGPGSGSVKADSIASAFRALYFDAAQTTAAPEFPHWTWSTQNRPGSGPLSTGAFYIAPRPIITPAAASNNITVAVPSGGLVLTGFAPTVLTPRAVAVPAASLTLTGVAPVVRTPRTVAAPAASLTLTGFSPTVLAPRRIQVPAGSLTLTGFPPSVVTAVNVAVPLGGLTLTALAPVVNVTANVRVSVPAGALTLTAIAPTVSASGGIVINVPAGALSLAAFAPSVVAPRTVAVPTGVIALTGLPPSVLTPRAAQVPVGALTISALAPTVATTSNVLVVVPAGQIVLTGYAPTVLGDLGASTGAVHGFEMGGEQKPRRRGLVTIIRDLPPDSSAPKTIRKTDIDRRLFEKARDEAREVIARVAADHAASKHTKAERFAQARTSLKPLTKALGDWNWIAVYQRMYQDALDEQLRQELTAEFAKQEAIAAQAAEEDERALMELVMEWM